MPRRCGDAAARPAHGGAELRTQAPVDAAAASVLASAHVRAVKRITARAERAVRTNLASEYERAFASGSQTVQATRLQLPHQRGAGSMGFGDAISSVLKNYATFSGRAPRSEFWYW